MKALIASSLVLVALGLQGCANTTHTINIEPQDTTLEAQYSNQRQIHVVVKPFQETSVGHIKTGIGEKADIEIGNNVQQALSDYMNNKLNMLGFKTNQGQLPATLFTIELNELSYVTKTIALKTEAKLTSQIRATVSQGEQTYTATFKSEKVDQYGTLPDREVVESEINELLGKTIDRAFKDKKLVQLLGQ